MPKKRFRVHGVSNSLWNEELAAVPRDERTWGVFRLCAPLGMMSVSLPAYLLASGLMVAGMSWAQALETILLGSVIVLIPMMLLAHAGARYGIPFPVYARASFGVVGAQVPAVLRSLVACGWFGIQCWIGGSAIFAVLKLIAPSWAVGTAVWYCFAGFWLLTMVVMLRDAPISPLLQGMSALLLLAVGGALLFWMGGKGGGFGVVLRESSLRHADGTTPPNFWRLFGPSLTAAVGFWAMLALNISDFTRYAKSQQLQRVGQVLGVPVAMTVWSLVAVIVTAALMAAPGHRVVWNPIELIAGFPQRELAIFGLVVVALAALVANAAAADSAKVFSNLRPNLISPRMGGVVVGVLGILCMPWQWMTNPERYIGGWLVGSSGVLGPIAGVMIVDYFIVRRRSLDVEGLYVRGGVYEYVGGFNPKAFAALALGVLVALVGLAVTRLHWLYEYAGFVGFGVAALVYLALMSGPAETAEIPPTPLLIPMRGFEGESAS